MIEEEFALTDQEESKVKEIMDELENDSYIRFLRRKMNGGFSSCEMFGLDERFIDIELKFGTQDDTGSDVHTEQYKIDRDTMELVN